MPIYFLFLSTLLICAGYSYILHLAFIGSGTLILRIPRTLSDTAKKLCSLTIAISLNVFTQFYNAGLDLSNIFEVHNGATNSHDQIVVLMNIKALNSCALFFSLIAMLVQVAIAIYRLISIRLDK